LKSKGLARAFAAARSNDPYTTIQIVRRFTGDEKKAFPEVMNFYHEEQERIANIYHLQIAKAKGVNVGEIYVVFSEDLDLAKKTDAIVNKSPEWKKSYRMFQQIVLTRLDALADLKQGAFGKSDFFNAWLEASLPSKKVADLLKLQKFKKADIVDLCSGFVLNDTRKMAQAIKVLEKSGLKMKPADVASLLQ